MKRCTRPGARGTRNGNAGVTPARSHRPAGREARRSEEDHMPVVRRYQRSLDAIAAVHYLRAHGIPATHITRADEGAAFPPIDRNGRNEVIVSDEQTRRAAEPLLDEMESEPARFDPGWEAASDRPDLTRLDPSITIPCPWCESDLPRDASITDCPHCNEPVDILDLLVHRHGPDILAPCYDTSHSTSYDTSHDPDPDTTDPEADEPPQ